MDKRFQVFISSTYADLKDERQKVMQAVMELDCIPAGMELFPAADEEQFEFIKRVIKDCDYYILIMGARYGSLTSDGVSYTEKEFEYAVSIGLKVIAFIHEAPDDIPVKKADIDPNLREKLQAFREKVSTGRLVKFWKKAEELPGLVSMSLSRVIKLYPAVGWARADNIGNSELLIDLNQLRKENEILRTTVQQQQPTREASSLDLAALDEELEVRITYTYSMGHRSYDRSESHKLTWKELFTRVAPDLLDHPNDASVSYRLGSSLYRRLHPNELDKSAQVIHDDFQTIKVQLTALGLVHVLYTKTVQGGMGLFWSLTEEGEMLMIRLRSVKSKQSKGKKRETE